MSPEQGFLGLGVDALRVDDEILLCAASGTVVVAFPWSPVVADALSAPAPRISLAPVPDVALWPVLREHQMLTETAGDIHYTLLPGFLPFRLPTGAWCIRCADELLIFRAEQPTELAETYRDFALTWEHEDHRRIARAFLKSRAALISPARFEGCLQDSLDRLDAPRGEVRRLALDLSGGKAAIAPSIEQLDAEIQHAIRMLAWPQQADRLLLLVPTILSADALARKPALKSAAVLSRHRLCADDELPPFQVGRGATLEEAAVRAIAESVERCCGQTPPTVQRRGHRQVELEHALELRRFPLASAHAPSSLDLTAYDASCQLDWVEVSSANGAIAWAPVDLVYYGAGLQGSTGARIFHTSSSGTAAHVDMEQARHNALLELIERDALMLYWASKAVPPPVPEQHLRPRAREAVARMRSLGFRILLRDLTLDLLPVALAAAVNSRGTAPFFLCGAGCGLSLAQGLDKAVEELETLVWHWHERSSEPPLKAVDVKSPMDHASFYSNPAHAEHLAFLLAESGRKAGAGVHFGEPDAGIVEPMLAARGIETFFRDLTTQDVRRASRLVVVRALATELIPITFGFRSEVTEGRRFREAAPGAVDLRRVPVAPHFFS